MFKKMKTNETQNVAIVNGDATSLNLPLLTEYITEGPFFETLNKIGASLAVTREYEHFVVFLGNDKNGAMQSSMELPHPSGMCFDPDNGDLLIASTRTPHQIYRFRPVRKEEYDSEIIPSSFTPPSGTMYIPYRSMLLPGDMYIHDVCLMDGEIYSTITGKNFLAKLDMDKGTWERVWWPDCIDGLGRSSFDQNFLQFNSVGAGPSPESSYYTSFSDETGGDEKPWEDGYGPKGRGVLFSGATRKPVIKGLTCPHSARFVGDDVWLCNSGYGSVGRLVQDETLQPEDRYEEVLTVPGFTRGLGFHGGYGFVGLSKVIKFYEPYAPGLKSEETLCGIVAFEIETGKEVARLYWPEGYQIYDVVVMPNASDCMLPAKREGDKINTFLRYLG